MHVVRNVFDQYDQWENRITHALVTALSQEPRLLSSFLRDVVGVSPPKHGKLIVQEQRLPGQEEVEEGSHGKRGIPDAWIHNEEAWCLLIESKVASGIRPSQLQNHISSARKRGYSDIHLRVIGLNPPRGRLPGNGKFMEWRHVYRWLTQQKKGSAWARYTAEYLEVAERKMVQKEQLKSGTLTEFVGFTFGEENPYNYGEARRLLKLAIGEVRKRRELGREIGVDLAETGRPAITGKKAGTSVWDILYFRRTNHENFGKVPHLTLSIESAQVSAGITIPNGLEPEYKRRLGVLGEDGFCQILKEVTRNAEGVVKRTHGAAPRCTAVQRRFHRSRKSKPINDARIEFDLRTVHEERDRSKLTRETVRYQPEWMQATYHALTNKRSNYQVQVGVIFPYDLCPEIGQPEAIDLLSSAWIACKPLIKVLLNGV